METIIIRYIDAPPAFKGCVKRDAEGVINMYINIGLSPSEKWETFSHEMKHVLFGHLDDDCLLTREEKELQAG